MHIVTGGLGVREGLEWRADDPYSAGARMEGPPRTNKAVTPAEAGAGRTGKCDNEQKCQRCSHFPAQRIVQQNCLFMTSVAFFEFQIYTANQREGASLPLARS
jgi:hypothetical protein